MVDARSMRKRLPPGPGGIGLGRLRSRIRDAVGFFENLHEAYGDAVCFRLLHRKFCAVFSPELIEEVLVTRASSFHKGPAFKRTLILNHPTTLTADGDDHRRLRKLVQPSFRRSALDGYAREMIEEIARVQDDWRDGDTFDIVPVMHRLTLDIVAATFFGRDVRIDASLIEDTLQTLQWSMKLTMIPMGGWIARLPLRNNRFRERTCRAMDRLIHQVAERARGDDARTDLISSLARATDDEGVERPLSAEEIRDEAYVMILAGYETSASALAWCFFHLARNPDVRERLEKEVDEVLGERPPTPESCRDLVYARAVFSETLRLVPPTWIVGRTAIEDCVIGDWFIPKGTVVQTCWRVPQRSDEHFHEALAFKPERWLGDPPPERRRLAYAPFGAGERKCVGLHFAMMEAVLALASISRRWRIELVSDESPEVSTLGFYRFRHGLPVTIRERR